MHVLGIDAGGTKTVCLLADEHGRVVSEARGGGANLQASGELEVEKVLHAVMEEAIGDRDLQPAAICLGIAGVDREADSAAVRGIMRRIGFKARTLVVNDALVALVAGAGDQPGVVIVAGTGSIAYGRDAADRAARAGGWGYVLGDEGGGFWIGRAALNAVVRQFDGRGPQTMLTEMVIAEMHLGSPVDLVHAVYAGGLHRYAIAAIAPVVQRAADQGDAVAADLISRAGVELVRRGRVGDHAPGDARGAVSDTAGRRSVPRGSIADYAGDVAARRSGASQRRAPARRRASRRRRHARAGGRTRAPDRSRIHLRNR